MKSKIFKKIISMSAVLKLFLITSISAANPAISNYNPGDGVTVIYLTNDTFKQLIFNYEKNKDWKYEGNKPAIIDFYAGWCGPCRELSLLPGKPQSSMGFIPKETLVRAVKEVLLVK